MFDLSGKTLAHGANARLVGKDNINMQDANGKFHVKERLDIAKAKVASELQQAASAKDAEIQGLKAKLDAGEVARQLGGRARPATDAA